MVMMYLLQSEIKIMSDVKWRPVASTILYDESGAVMVYKGDIVYKQIFHQLKKDMIQNLDTQQTQLNWQADDGLILRPIGEVRSWV